MITLLIHLTCDCVYLQQLLSVYLHTCLDCVCVCVCTCVRASDVDCIYHTFQVYGPFLSLVAFAPVEPSW